MAVTIDNFRIKNQARGRNGKVTLLATFDVNLGAISIKGVELLRMEQNNNIWASVPHNRYQDKRTQEWRKFNYVGFNGERGNALLAEFTRMAEDEYRRRSSQPQTGGGSRQPYQRGGQTGGYQNRTSGYRDNSDPDPINTSPEDNWDGMPF